jgi:hypothetical protein
MDRGETCSKCGGKLNLEWATGEHPRYVQGTSVPHTPEQCFAHSVGGESKLWVFEVKCNDPEMAIACHRCERKVLCAMMGGLPFCYACLTDAKEAIADVADKSGKAAR